MTDEKIKPVAWMQSDHMNGPLYPESAITQAREEGRREGMREAKEIVKPIISDAETLWGDKFDEKYGDVTCFEAVEAAITRAAEGK